MFPIKKPAILSSVFAGSGVTTAVLAKLACPFCYPAAAGLISSLGLGYLINDTNLSILAAVLIAATLFGLAYRAKSRRGFAPFLLGVTAVTAGAIGKYTMVDPLFYIGIGGLIGASIWNVVPKRSCSACATGTTSKQNVA